MTRRSASISAECRRQLRHAWLTLIAALLLVALMSCSAHAGARLLIVTTNPVAPGRFVAVYVRDKHRLEFFGALERFLAKHLQPPE